LIAATEDPAARSRLWFWITSSLATSQKAYLEQRITTAMAAIEYLAYVDEVVSGEKSEDDFSRTCRTSRRPRVASTLS
jgi:hypothetical protein